MVRSVKAVRRNSRCGTKSTKRRVTRTRPPLAGALLRGVRVCTYILARCTLGVASVHARARSQETATIILQIISREHAIPLEITRLRRGQRCTPRPLFARTCAHTRRPPRATRGFLPAPRDENRKRRTRKEAAPLARGCLAITVINRDVKTLVEERRDVSVAFGRGDFLLKAPLEGIMRL